MSRDKTNEYFYSFWDQAEWTIIMVVVSNDLASDEKKKRLDAAAAATFSLIWKI